MVLRRSRQLITHAAHLMGVATLKLFRGMRRVSREQEISHGTENLHDADMIFVGGTVITVDTDNTRTEALAVTAGKIVAVGKESVVRRRQGPQTQVVDLRGGAILPAFVEAHGHPSFMAMFLAPPAIDVRPFTQPSGSAVMATLRSALEKAEHGEIIFLYGIDTILQTDLELPTMALLDAMAPHNPVILVSNSAHAAYGNTHAFTAAGITVTTPNPEGAEYVRDAEGNFTGEVLEVTAVMTLIQPYLTKVAAGDAQSSLAWAYAQLAAAGIATTSEHAMDRSHRELWEKAAQNPDITVRVRAYEIGTADRANDPSHTAGDIPGAEVMFAKIGMKLWADGSPWQGNIYTSFPYLDSDTTRRMGLCPAHRGGMNYTPEQLTTLATAFVKQGWQLSCHVHGDEAVDAVLDAYEAARPPASSRSRVEHAGAMTPQQFVRATGLGVHPSFFIQHVYFWGDSLVDELFGEERGAHWMSAKSALRAGARISFHNDGTVTPPDPVGNIATAVTRRARGSGRVLASEERLSVDQALRAQTIDAAWQLHLDQDIGSLERGKTADLVILSSDPYSVDPTEIRHLKVRATYLAGRETYRAPE